ncbi:MULTISPECIES: hypothetical protein [Flavobacterium]|uniref:DUF4329 domain-containing protein n=1 Tax=Flavobacterium hankyongi TaxID=1176532 RepID=A0ABP9A8E3_9FLAO|nr:hypothetical protein [Flavobacterium sp. N1846]
MKFKILPYLSILVMIFSSCEVQEDYIEITNTSQNFKRSSKSYKELITEKNFTKAFSKIPKKKVNKINELGRTQMEDEYGFTIYDTPINIMESDSLLVYNLLIKSDTLKTGNYFENLVLNTNKFTNETKAYIFKYNLTSQIEPTIHNSVSFTANVAIKPIIYSGNIMARYGDICYTHHYAMCYELAGDGIFSQPHRATEYCSGAKIVNFSEEVCVDFQGGGATGIPTTPSTPSNPGGSSGSGNTPIYSNPTPPCDPRVDCPIIDQAQNNPCTNLKKHLSGVTGIKLKSPGINDFLKNNLNQNKEFGFFFKKENGIYTSTQSNNSSSNKITIKVGEYYFASIHTHPYPGGNPMFSWEDLFSLQQYYQNAQTNLLEEVAVYLVCKDNNGNNQLYALKIDDFDMFSNYLTNDISNTITPQDLAGLTTDEQRLRTILDIMNAKQHKYNLQNFNINQEVPFLNYFAGCGATLYKANASLTNWDKPTLSNSATSPITNIPCN